MTENPGQRLTQFDIGDRFNSRTYLDNSTTTRSTPLHSQKQTGSSVRTANKLSKNQVRPTVSNPGSKGVTAISRGHSSPGKVDRLAESVVRTSPWDLYTPQFKLKLNGYVLVAESSQHGVVAIKRFSSDSQTYCVSPPQLLKNAGGHRNLMLPISIHRWQNSIYLIFDYTSLSLAQFARSPADVSDQHLAGILRQVRFSRAIAF